MTSPVVSVVLPTYNAERYVGAAIETVLAQTYVHHEIVVVDDGSIDNTSAVVARFGDAVRYVRQANAGVSAARNRGIAASSGELIAFLDADDLWLPSKLERQVAALEAHPNAAFAYCGLHLIDEDGRFIGRMRPAPPERALRNTLLLERPLMSIVTAVVRREVLDAEGGFDEVLSTSADCDLACRIALRHEVTCVADPLVLWRQHGDGMHTRPDLTEHDVRIIFPRFFGDPALPSDIAGRRRRAWANLHMSLAGAYIRQGQRNEAVPHVLRAALFAPTRVVAALGRLTRPGGPEGLPPATRV